MGRTNCRRRSLPLLFVCAFLVVPLLYAQSSAAADQKSAVPPSLAGVKPDWRKVKPEYKPFECYGEVVDSWCYASHSVGTGRGPEHARCANACAHGGVTLGIVDDRGTMYIAAKYRAYSGCQQLLEPFVAKRVHVKGFLATIGGCNILKINTVEEVGADNSPLAAKKAKT